MGLNRIGGWVRTCALAVSLVLQPMGAPALRLAAVALPVAAVETLVPADAQARASSSSSRGSSGGYSRPSSSRTPSVGGGGYSRPSSGFSSGSRTPSTGSSSSGSWFGGSSGGYARPSTSASPATPPPSSAGDSAISRQGSGAALDRYRTPPAAPPPPVSPPASSTSGSSPARPSPSSPPPSGSSSGASSGLFRYPPAPRTPATQAPAERYRNAYSGYGWTPPAHALGGQRRFGVWDGVFLWFLLDTLSRPGHAAFFNDHADDPGMKEWRAAAEKRAQEDAGIRDKLTQLDASMAQQASTPRQPDRLPPDVPPELARAEGTGGGGIGGVIVAVLLLAVLAAVIVLLLRRRRRSGGTLNPVATPVANQKDSAPMFGSLGNYVGAKLSGQPYRPSLFRVGMAITLDPTPFILAEGVTKVAAPALSGTDRLVSVEAVGTLTVGEATLYRLYLPGDSFFQIHLDAGGQPDECRYFVPIDRVTPADEGEWGVWLDGAEGMIGWPEFQTKDGKLYARTWMPGDRRVAPVGLDESLVTIRGTAAVRHQAMLYGAATGAADPAPPYEYIMVAVVERDGQAWVEIAAGIDVNPASLSLS